MSTAAVAPEGVRVLLLAVGTADDPAWVRRAVKRAASRRAPRCPHLPKGSAAPRIVFADDGQAKCWPCATEYAERPTDGPFGEAADTRAACGSCGAQVSLWDSRCTVLAVPPLYVALELCAPCVATLQPAERGEV